MARFASPHDALRAGVAIAGGQSAFGRLVGCTQGNIWLLLKNRKALPGRFCIAAETGTGISRSEYNPKLYPPEAPAADPATRFEAVR